METIGSLVDKISICSLKIYHMKEQLIRKDVSEEFIENCSKKIEILEQQRRSLTEELDYMLTQISEGTYQNKVFYQCKMYNEKQYRD